MKNESHLVITGLAGTGKSYQITKRVNRLIEEGALLENELLLLSFNKELKTKAINRESCYNKFNTHTIHSLAFRLLKRNDKLPEVFIQKEVSIENIETNTTTDLQQKDYNDLISQGLKLKDEEISGVFPDIKLIICDEYQDFREDYISFVKRLMGIYKSKIIIAGDPFQNINLFQNKKNDLKIKENFKNIKKDLGISDYTEIILNENHRSNPAIFKFINGMLLKCFDIENGYLYDIKKKPHQNRYEKPIIRFFSTQQDEKGFIERMIKMYGKNKNITILTRYKREQLIFEGIKQTLFDRKSLTVSSIHKYKGNQADIIFLSGFNCEQEMSEDEKYILYTAISRAKRKLIITSAYPAFDLDRIFDKETYTFTNSQRKLTKSNKQLKKIRTGGNFTLKKLGESNIDSLVLKVKAKDCPFPRYVKRGNVKQEKTSNKMIQSFNGVDVTIKMNHRHKIYYFEFLDLNLLKKSGYSDKGIISFCLNFIIVFFDYRIDTKKIQVHRLDLCRFIKFKDNRELDYFFDFFNCYIKDSHSKDIKDNEYRVNGIDYKENEDKEFDWKKYKTLYINHNKNKSYGATTKVYFPFKKENKNVINIPGLLKLEFTLKGDYFKSKDMLGSE